MDVPLGGSLASSIVTRFSASMKATACHKLWETLMTAHVSRGLAWHLGTEMTSVDTRVWGFHDHEFCLRLSLENYVPPDNGRRITAPASIVMRILLADGDTDKSIQSSSEITDNDLIDSLFKLRSYITGITLSSDPESILTHVRRIHGVMRDIRSLETPAIANNDSKEDEWTLVKNKKRGGGYSHY